MAVPQTVSISSYKQDLLTLQVAPETAITREVD